ncbi:MAG: hypothetical protein PHV13_06075 [Candidatus ainarchaeum sp.]|nr:hypothetical protein [Candidatus ainarchaeum sp.]
MADFAIDLLGRLAVLVQAPLTDQHMLWTAVPLLIATLFITLYFGKYKQEELGWNTAFGNTMVFLFVSINIIQYMYYSTEPGSWGNVISNSIYLSSALALIGVAILLMLLTYYHLLPKKVAFFLFSAAPVNVSVYVIMTIIYTSVPADTITLLAALLLFLLIFAILKGIQMLEAMASRPEGLALPEEPREEKLLRKMKDLNVKLAEKRRQDLGQEDPGGKTQ